MFCYKCGFNNDENAKFCVKCGTVLKMNNAKPKKETVNKAAEEPASRRNTEKNYDNYTDRRSTQKNYDDYEDRRSTQKNYDDYEGRRSTQKNYDDYEDRRSTQKNYDDYEDRRSTQRNYDDYEDRRSTERDYDDNRSRRKADREYDEERYERRKPEVKRANKPKTGKKKSGGKRTALIIVLIIIIAAAAAAAIIFLLLGKKTSIKLSDYLNVSLEGENGEGYVSADLDIDKIVSDNSGVFKMDDTKKSEILSVVSGMDSDSMDSASDTLDSLGLGSLGDLASGLTDAMADMYSDEDCIEMLFDYCISGEFDNYSELSNGDKITYTWKVDEESFQKVFSVSFDSTAAEFEISGLAEETASTDSGSGSNDQEAAPQEDADAAEAEESEEEESEQDSDKDSDKMSIPTATATPTATPTPTEAVKATAAVQTAASTSMNGYNKLSIAGAASSVACLVQTGSANAGIDNSANSAVDGNEVTSWQEGVDGYGIGAYLDLQLGQESSVHAITFKMGNWRDAGQFNDNARPKDITIWLDNQSYSVTIPDGMTEYAVVFSSDVKASRIKVVIDSVYTAEWEDTCISEITVYGK